MEMETTRVARAVLEARKLLESRQKPKRRRSETTSQILSWVEDHLRNVDEHLRKGYYDTAVWNVYSALYLMGRVYSRLEASKKNPWHNARFRAANDRLSRATKVIEECLRGRGDPVVEAIADPVACAAAAENDLRRKIGTAINAERAKRNLSIRSLAKEIGTSVSQVQRLLHREVGGSLTLRTIVRAAQVLDLAIDLRVRPRR